MEAACISAELCPSSFVFSSPFRDSFAERPLGSSSKSAATEWKLARQRMTPPRAATAVQPRQLSMESIQAWQWRYQGNEDLDGRKDTLRSRSVASTSGGEEAQPASVSQDALEKGAGGPEDQRLQTPAHLPKPLSTNQSNINRTGQLRVAYQGAAGAYSEAAAYDAFPGCEAVPCEQFDAAFQAVELWLVDRAVLPIENSLGGSIHRNYDLLMRHRLYIVGEVNFPVNHCLLALPGVRKEDLKRVLSHPQALAQTEGYLSALGVIREAAADTAGSAQLIAQEGWTDAGAIASRRAGEIYGLDVLAEGVQDEADNVTRFLMLARDQHIPRLGVPYKTSIVFTLEEAPGALFKALAVFSLRDINLTKIESRPQRAKPLQVVQDLRNQTSTKAFQFLFYIDFMASMAEERAQNALRHLQEIAPFLRVLGSYPMDTRPL
ncbi:arogenate or prephenate dehydratase [Klebsormidium nitens]|uniref:Arogenate dehydratase n=1 Tax=Klebsormidium nitens TaxID=105231 RepID=A0A1Y1IJ61_KLENI|nr:arogenate or prephenate dehydratase [Klebsormidium nitens]|eukprot:GAQ88746.1 arogenate or prephenate dehydratase [Klebsormidium nitens]